MRIVELIGTELAWNQPSVWKNIYHLYAAGEQIAVLAYDSVWRTRGTIQSQDGCWSFRSRSFWATMIDFSLCGSEQPVAVYERNFWKGGGVFVLPYEHRLNARFHAWKGEISVTLPGSEQVLLHYRRQSAWRVSGIFNLTPAVERLPSLPLAVFMGWYAQVQAIRDQIAAAAA